MEEALPAGPRAGKEGHAATASRAGEDIQALVDRARQGDRAALRRLIEAHQRRVYQLALGIVKNHHDALDVVQETFVRVHQNLPSFKGDAAFSTWLHRIAYNAAIDQVRRNNGRGESVEVEDRTLTEAVGLDEPMHVRSPQAAYLSGELGEHLQRALSQLSENHRAILLMREVDGLSYEELAQALGVPKGTVMSRLFHARQKMQAALRGYVQGEDPEDESGETATAARAVR